MSEDTILLREDIINSSLLRTALDERYGKDVQYVSHKNSLATKKGDNFVGDLIAVDVQVHDLVKNEEKTLHWICKAMKNDKSSKLMEKLQLFDREEAFYKKFIKDLEKYVGPKLLRSVPLIYSQNEPGKQILIFEHLGFMGYKELNNKKDGLNEDAVFGVLEWLAELHGAGFLLMQRYPGGYEEWKRDNFYAHPMPLEAIDDLQTESINSLLMTLEDTKNGSENDSFLESFIPLYKDFFENRPEGVSLGKKMIDLLYTPRSSFTTLTHGDPWFNNMMAKYGDDESVKDIILLDMQGVMSGNIGSDLAYFLFACVTYEDLSTKLDVYLEHYRKCLSKFITDKDPKQSLPLSFEDIKNDFIKSSIIGFQFSVGSFPHVLVEKEDMIQVDLTNIDWTIPEEMSAFMEKSRAHAKKLIQSKPQLYNRLLGSVRLMLDLKAFDLMVY